MSFDLRDLLTTRTSVNHSISPYQKADGDYYLIMVESGEVYAAKMVFSTAGIELHRAYVAAHPTKSERQNSIGGSVEQNKFEGYVLGQLESLEEQIKIGDYTTIGNTLADGWQFNWDGSEAVCVTHESFTVMDGEVERLSHWTATHYKLSIIEDAEGALSASVSSEESIDWQPTNGGPHVWRPSSAGQMYPWQPVGCSGATVTGYGGDDSDVPLYAYYKGDGVTPKVYRFEVETQAVNDIDDLVQEAAEEQCSCYGNQAAGYGYQESEYEGYLDAVKVRLYTTDGESYEAFNWGGGYYQKLTCLIRNDGGANVFLSMAYTDANHYCKTSAFTNTWGNIADFEVQVAYGQTVREYSNPASPTLYNGTAYPVLIIPGRSSESAYILMGQSINYSVTIDTQTAYQSWAEIRQMSDPIGEDPAPVTDWYPVYYPAHRIYECDPLYEEDWALTECTVPRPTISGTINTGRVTDTWEKHEVTLTFSGSFETSECEHLEVDTLEELEGYYGFILPALCSSTPREPLVENFQSAFGNSIRVDSLYEYPYSFESNNSVPADKAAPTGMWLGRA